MAVIDRNAAATAMAKAIAYKQCGKDDAANEWARRLIELLECADILCDDRGATDLRLIAGGRA